MSPIALDEPNTSASLAAREVAAQFYPPSLLNHCLRSYQWGALLAARRGIAMDHELLYVSAMLHDLGLVRAFDNHCVAFEQSGADLAWLFGAAAGWSIERRSHSGTVIINHMADEILPPGTDPESHLLSLATAMDISGSRFDEWPESERRGVVETYPRHDLSIEFVTCFRDQAKRKPDSSPARALNGGIAERIARNPLDWA